MQEFEILPIKPDSRKHSLVKFDEMDGIDKTELMSMSLNLKALIADLKSVETIPSQYTNHPGWFVVAGSCGHSYHLDNIQKWTDKKSHPTCPVCTKPWEPVVIIPITLWPGLDTTLDKKKQKKSVAKKLNVSKDLLFL